MTMVRLTREAQARLDGYLQDMRASVHGTTSVDVAEIEQDIRDHVDAELAACPAPVSEGDLEAVLRRLGSPRQWATESDVVSWRTLPSPLAGGSEDRLAYASAACLVLGLLFVMLAVPTDSRSILASAPLLIAASWVLARWALARIDERGEPVGARVWLLYVPLAIVAAPLAVLAFLWPFGAFAEIGGALYGGAQAEASRGLVPVRALAVAFGGLGAYWVILGALVAKADRLVRFVLRPFADGLRPRHGWWLCGVGAALAAAAAGVTLGGR